MKLYYGLSSNQNLVELCGQVCDVLGHGSNESAHPMLIETCCAETHAGTVRDKTLYGAGAGVSQVDESTFDWLKAKFLAEYPDVVAALKEHFNVDLAKVQYRELDFSPLLALIFARLRYRTVTAPIPADKAGRAAYWKQHYNTDAGKGSAAEYIERVKHCNILYRKWDAGASKR
jgi:hypothetical protein